MICTILTRFSIISNTEISNNYSTRTDGIHEGIGLMAVGISGPMTLSDTKINNNIAGGVRVKGGGAHITNNASSNVLIERCEISGNQAAGRGGGLYLRNEGSITIVDTTISNNTGDRGGGLYAKSYQQTLSISNSTISGNSAGISGGGVDLYNKGTVTISDTTISGNTAGKGGVYTPTTTDKS